MRPKSLRLAQQQLDELIKEVDGEVARATGDANETANAAGRQPQANAQPGTRPERQGGQPSGERSGEQESESGQQAQQGGPPRDGGQPRDSRGDRARADAGEQTNPNGGGSWRTESGPWDDQGARGPFTGEDFLGWSDRLRDVEDMLPERELRDEAARVWDRARAVRAEFKRHGKEPQWDLVRSQIMEPLAELRQRVGERLAQLQSDEALVPIDRDPVPDRFADLVRSYFEHLGQEGQ